MLTVRVGGAWLHSIGSYAELAYSHTWPHGSEAASWRMPFGTRHEVLRGGALVEIFDGGVRIWRGRLSEPSAGGEFAASGSWHEGEGVYALDGSGNATNVPDTAIDAAIARGAITGTRPASLSAASWGTAGEPMSLTQLLDEAMAGLAKRWYVDADGAWKASTDPTTPSYYVPHAVAGHGLTLADDSYYSHLVGRYVTAWGPPVVYASLTVGDAAAAAKWGRKEGLVDLTQMGVITAPTATTELTNRLALVGARMGFAEGLELGPGQLTTPGGTAVTLTIPQAGAMVRLLGVRDETRTTANLPYTDIVMGESSYSDETDLLSLKPVGMAARNLADVLKVAVS